MTFGQGEDLIQLGRCEFFNRSAGPVDLNGFNCRCVPQAEMHARIVRGGVACSCNDVSALLFSARGQVDGCSYSIARALRPTDELQINPGVLIR